MHVFAYLYIDVRFIDVHMYNIYYQIFTTYSQDIPHYPDIIYIFAGFSPDIHQIFTRYPPDVHQIFIRYISLSTHLANVAVIAVMVR